MHDINWLTPFGDYDSTVVCCLKRKVRGRYSTRNAWNNFRPTRNPPTPSRNHRLTSLFLLGSHVPLPPLMSTLLHESSHPFPPYSSISSAKDTPWYYEYGGFNTSRPRHAKPQGCNAQCCIGTWVLCKSLPEMRQLGANQILRTPGPTGSSFWAPCK